MFTVATSTAPLMDAVQAVSIDGCGQGETVRAIVSWYLEGIAVPLSMAARPPDCLTVYGLFSGGTCMKAVQESSMSREEQ